MNENNNNNYDDININNSQFNSKINQSYKIESSNNYQKELNEYLNEEKMEKNPKEENNNDSNFYKNQINCIKGEIILLKSKISENELIINQYKKTIEELNVKHSEELEVYQNKINELNNYIIAIYKFFNNITTKYIPSLKFYYDNDNSFSLINQNEFNAKLNIIENYISSIQNNTKENINYQFNKVDLNQNILQNENQEEISTSKFNEPNSTNDFIKQSNSNERKNIIEDITNYNSGEFHHNNQQGLVNLYKNLEEKFDMLEKEIEAGKKNRYDYTDESINSIRNNAQINCNLEIQKQMFLENLYKKELKKKKSKNNKEIEKNKKKYSFSKIDKKSGNKDKNNINKKKK